jgi:Secretion system C-terminal sorting domain
MNKITKQHTHPQPPAEQKLRDYLTQTAYRVNGRKVAHGALALLTPLAASSLITNQAEAQCITRIQPGLYVGSISNVFLDLDGDGLATFALANITVDSQQIFQPTILAVGGGDPGGYVQVVDVQGVGKCVANEGSHTMSSSAAFFKGNGNASPAPLAFGGVFKVKDSNGTTFTLDVTIAPSTGFITINSINGNVPPNCNPPLPVELTTFSLSPKANSLQLNWATASETNNKGFEVERSTDGAQFRKIGWVEGEGNSQKNTPYTFEDTHIKPGILYYYRLKQVDMDGRAKLTHIVTGKVDSDAPVQVGQVFPNPVRHAIQMEVAAKEEGEVTYALYDQLGKLVLQGTQELSVGQNALKVDVAAVPVGNYYLKMNAGVWSDYKKVIIAR